MKNTDKRILLVEDNERIRNGNQQLLEWEGYSVAGAASIAEARNLLEQFPADAIILDIMLPDGSGLDYLKVLRSSTEYSSIPVLLLTGLSAQQDVLQGLQSGGDDYLVKPYDFPILLARLQALLRRASRVPDHISIGMLTLDLSASIAELNGRDLLLTQKEFALLLIFVQNPKRYIDGEYLYEKVWNQPLSKDGNALKSSIKRLRSKIQGSGWQIIWSRGEGYSLVKE